MDVGVPRPVEDAHRRVVNVINRWANHSDFEVPYTEAVADVEDTCWYLWRETMNPPVVVRFHVDGEPVSKQRARWSGAHGAKKTYTPRQTSEAEEKLAWAFRAARSGWVVDDLNGFGVHAVFFAATFQRRDVDNMLKLVLDAMNGVVWKDDAQVSEVSARVVRGVAEPRTEVLIYRAHSGGQPPEARCERCGKAFRLYKSTSDSKYCSRTCADATRSETGFPSRRRNVTCAGCGAEFYPGPHKRKYCTPACRQTKSTVDLVCVRCSKQFKQWASWQRSGAALCSRECAVAFWRESGATKNPKGTCGLCGGPTSRKEYLRCGRCARAARASVSRAPKTTTITDIAEEAPDGI